MNANTLVRMRPPQPPVLDPVLEGRDPFHPAIASGSGWALPEGTREQFAIAKANVQAHQIARNDRPSKPGDDLVVIPLGTSSATSSRYRNGTSIDLAYAS
jgi:ribonuclease Z